MVVIGDVVAWKMWIFFGVNNEVLRNFFPKQVHQYLDQLQTSENSKATGCKQAQNHQGNPLEIDEVIVAIDTLEIVWSQKVM